MYNVAFDLYANGNTTWTSPDSGIRYAREWNLAFANGDYLDVKSVLGDQEIYGGPGNHVYEGFVKVKGSFLGLREGYGLVEVVS